MELTFTCGLSNEKTDIVSNTNTAIHYGSGTLPVYASPAMFALMEGTAAESIEDKLPVGMSSVGIDLSVKHSSATPIGMKVRAVSELVEIDGKKLTFHVTAFDEKGQIGEGTHERFIISSDKFLQKTQAKLTAPSSK